MRTLLTIGLTLAVTQPARASSPDTAIKLAVVIVVDQMRPDYLDRFADLYTGGLARLSREGAVFEHAYHDQSCTLTGPGHATLSTGCLPAHHGIVGNYYYDRLEQRVVYSCSDSTARTVDAPEIPGVSPRRLLRPTFAELFKKARPAARVVSVALKDRAAIFLAGKGADAVLWFEEEAAGFVTSSFYSDSLPGWVEDFHQTGLIHAFADSLWDRLLPYQAYERSRHDEVLWEHDGEHTEFPHPCNPGGGTAGPDYYGELPYMPFGDLIVLKLAQRASSALQLGQDDVPDLLLVGCSAADGVGHRFGPHSHEVQDYYLRLDRYLDAFFRHLDSSVGQGRWLVALASDHGVMPIPEVARRYDSLKASRLMTDSAVAQVTPLVEAVSDKWDIPLKLKRVEDGFVLDPQAWPDSAHFHSAVTDLVVRMRMLDWIADVYTRWDLADQDTPLRPYGRMFGNALHPERGADLYVLEAENLLVTSSRQGTTHGSPYTYDTHVPLVFLGAGIHAGHLADSVRTVDLAPTILDLLGVTADAPFDGASLREKLR